MSTLEPNLKEYTLEEAVDLSYKAIALEEKGLFEEAEQIRLQIPLLPVLANNLKNELGIQGMIETGVNLSRAVREYGYKWLEK